MLTIKSPLLDVDQLIPASIGAPTTEWLSYAVATQDTI